MISLVVLSFGYFLPISFDLTLKKFHVGECPKVGDEVISYFSLPGATATGGL